MAVTPKVVDLTDTEYTSEQEWAENTKGIYMNLLAGIRHDPVDNKYKIVPIKYSNTPLEGEKVKFASGQEFIVICSVLAEEFANKQEVKDKWIACMKKLKDDYIEARKLDAHIASHNTDLRKLRKEGNLLDKDQLVDDEKK